MHRWDPRTVLAHLDTNPIKCTYLHYAYTITVALIYNVCERDVLFIYFSLCAGRQNTLCGRQLVLCWVHRSYRGGGVN